MKEEDTKEGLLERIKNIEDKKKEKLHEIKYQGERHSNMVNEQWKKERA